MKEVNNYKKIFYLTLSLVFTGLFIGCASTNFDSKNTKAELADYYAHSEEECTFAFEFFNRSTRALTIYAYIGDTKKMNKELSPVLKTQDILVQPGKSVIFNLNSDLLIKDFNKKYSFGLNCYEKNWHWWQETGKDMKNKRVRIIVDNDYNEGGRMLYPPFKYQNKFAVREVLTEYENKPYYMYYLTETNAECSFYYDTTVFYKKPDDGTANIYAASCLSQIEEMLNKGDFIFIRVKGYDYIMLNSDPLNQTVESDILPDSELRA